jgi:hypothetical protein
MPSLLYIFGLYTSRAMGRTTLARKNLLAWQWSDYPSRHQDAGNLMLHIVVVPLFQVATLVLAYGVVTGRVGAVGLAALGMVVSVVAQGRGHRRERERTTPFMGFGDFVTRFFVEQWVTFPRFVLSGGWYRNLQQTAAPDPGRQP